MSDGAISLSPHLDARVASGRPGPAPGGHLLYWMRSAVRGHENPALDVALEASRTLGLPLLVYHALSERYPYASYRHHRFIMEGARDAHRELAARGIRAVFHLERPGHRGPHLLTLARGAALVVTEHVPVPFLERWTRVVAEAAPTWAVDASTLVSVYRVPRGVTDRAFRFREAAEPLWRPWLDGPWPEVPEDAVAEVGAHSERLPALPFEPVPVAELDDAALGALVAECAVDPTVGPVPHTRGGSEAGYARWRAFRDGGLARYHRDRNDPLRPGVSRMSAWLHHGHVSPFRIAREAAAAGEAGAGEGARKYLDELLTWRELAWSFCHHVADPESLDALPAWARATLAAHAYDPRPALVDPETLARGKTGDALWDAAQRSLLVHGELHNNVRMTWGKALLGWTPDPATALETLVDLNHRYALDGRDPASYGGILWCLGAFDRPFPPGRPVLGTVRARETADHAARLDVGRWSALTGRPLFRPVPRVGVIGAGMAGLAAARVLSDHGLRVRVFDKGRGVGGRMATREAREAGEARPAWAMDHGAPCFTARDPVFARWVRGWARAGIVAPWSGRIVHVGEELSPATEAVRWVGVPGMRSVAAHLAADLDVETGHQVPPLARDHAGRWIVSGEEFDLVVLTPPPPQAAALLAGAHPALAARIGTFAMLPCWAVMVRFEDPVEIPWDAAFVDPGAGEGARALSWVARDTSKPGRGTGEHWVLHGAPEWSLSNLETPGDDAADALLGAFATLVADAGGAENPLPGVTEAVPHRWRYARPAEGGSVGYLWDAKGRIGVAGDALGGGRVEGAFTSGTRLAGRILLELAARRADPPRVSSGGGSPPR